MHIYLAIDQTYYKYHNGTYYIYDMYANKVTFLAFQNTMLYGEYFNILHSGKLKQTAALGKQIRRGEKHNRQSPFANNQIFRRTNIATCVRASP